MLAGLQEVHVNGVTYTLYPGDTISFQSSLPHWFRNPGDEILVGICIARRPRSDETERPSVDPLKIFR